MRNLEYRMFGATMRLIVLVWLMTTLLLVTHFLQAGEWVTVTISLVGGWVLRDGAAKAAEAYRDAKNQNP